MSIKWDPYCKTNPSEKAGTPRELKVIEISDGSQHRAEWLPPYPPTGCGKYNNLCPESLSKSDL